MYKYLLYNDLRFYCQILICVRKMSHRIRVWYFEHLSSRLVFGVDNYNFDNFPMIQNR